MRIAPWDCARIGLRTALYNYKFYRLSVWHFCGSAYVSTSAQKYVMYRKPTNIAQVFWDFMYITYFVDLYILTYTEPGNLSVFVVARKVIKTRGLHSAVDTNSRSTHTPETANQPITLRGDEI